MAGSKWLILELSDAGVGATRAELESALRTLLDEEIEWFIPIHHEKMGSYVSTSVLFEGYVFVKDGVETRTCLQEIRDHRMFAKVLQVDGKYQTIDSYTVGALRRKLKNSIKREFIIGTFVKILEGVFTDLIGEVIGTEDEGRKVVVRVKRQSREWVVPLPSTSVAEADPMDVPITDADSTGVISCTA